MRFHFGKFVAGRQMTVSPIRIFMVDPDSYSSAYDKALILELQKLGIQLDLFATGNIGAIQPIVNFYEHSNKRPPGLVKKLIKLFEHIVSMFKLCVHANRLKPAVIHFQWIMLPCLDWPFIYYLSKRFRILHTVHNLKAFHGDSKFILQSIGYNGILKLFHGLITLTKGGQDSLIKRLGMKVIHIPHGLLTTHHLKPLETGAAPKGQIPKVLFLGRIRPYKGIDIFLKALLLLRNRSSTPFHAVIAGELELHGRDRQEFVRLARELPNLTMILKFIDENEMAQLVGEASVAVLPYREIDASGIFSIVISNSLPCYCTRIGIFEETFSESYPAALFEVDGVESLAQRLEDFLNNSETRSVLKRKVSEALTHTPGWNEIAKAHTSFYLNQ